MCMHCRYYHEPGAPVYVLAGHAGAGFTHGFPDQLPEWVASGHQDRNGYLRFTASAEMLKMEVGLAGHWMGIMNAAL